MQVGIDVVGLDTLSAVVPEARFDAAPVVPGQAVTLSWMPGDVHEPEEPAEVTFG